MSAPEFSREIDIRSLSSKPVQIEADEAERAALARRFLLVAVKSLAAEVTLEDTGDAIIAKGRLHADIVQSCAVSGEDLPVMIDEKLHLRFVEGEEVFSPDEEVELDEAELDDIPFDGQVIDLGEAMAQTLALSVDPYAIGPNAEAARVKHGLIEEGKSGPLAEALAALKKGG